MVVEFLAGNNGVGGEGEVDKRIQVARYEAFHIQRVRVRV